METQISFSNQEKYTRQGFMQRNALSVKIILIGVLILILLIPLAMIRGLISERSETASEATTEVQNKWSSSQLVTGPFISIPCYENYEETYYENGATKISVKKVKNYIHILPELLDITGNVEHANREHCGYHSEPIYEDQGWYEPVYSEVQVIDYYYCSFCGQRQ